MTIQQQMKETLAKSGIAYREIEVYGSQIVITSSCRDTADKWAALVATFAKVRRVLQSWDDAVVNKNTVMMPTKVKVWRTYAVM